ncbi:lysine-2,3-aminomutase-like protein [Hyphomicrobium sp.]|uniref:lysine-2,3-aminomutase-like protein n=1 Tax=Hyphomicrobium sp. TaxID=82 RepID=UPI002C11C4C2|nr:lysine-2,3-aminomutase-like protein [Hyphomicrobium sp.]HRN88703.1 lysine-2,3-aminomutase-like protein [Hyphomicrobium sp.]HRQ25858.1 lysine-2,3-aminomutase-like protein [Hyphomicrobium sp.]
MTRLRQTLRSASDLVDAGFVPAEREEALATVGARYAVAVTPAMAELIDPRDPADPIARQFVPDVRELDTTPQERADPIGDHAKSPVRGVVHRYPDRVLLKVVGVCPVYCRFCFRREMVGPAAEANLTAIELDAALAYIRDHPEIWEVILTGGDPFIMSPRRMEDVSRALGAISHVKVIRWHTRVPVVAPERVTSDLVSALRASGKTVYVALHANHARELTDLARAAIARLVEAGVPLVSQTVLLRGVNDDVDTLEALMRAFVEARVTPYYLHHGDLAPGTAHFRTSIDAGQALMHALRQRLSGLAMPTYVLDIPGGHGKVPIGPEYLDDAGTVRDPSGNSHRIDGSCAP